uniref:Uncharacterized protein n=1 Tax=Strongyloides venezuelensis TaxID=75913 RepID=A0A0K0FFG4_STRVS
MIVPCCNDDKRQLSHILLLLYSLISSLLTENLSSDNLDSNDKSFKLWFNERSPHLGSIVLSLKNYLHLHYKNLYEKFGPLELLSCFFEESVLHNLIRLLLRRSRSLTLFR